MLKRTTLLGISLAMGGCLFFIPRMEGGAMSKLILKAGKNGSVSAPVRFAAPEGFEGVPVLEGKGPGGTVFYAQRDGDEFVAIAPGMEPGETLEYMLSPASNPPIRVLCNQRDSQIEVTIDGKPFTTYHYSRELKKPFLYPVLLEGKYRLTRGYPMEDIEGEPKDHHHHRSWWVAYGEVNGSDFWAEKEDPSQQRTVDILEVVSGPVFGKIRALNSWNNVGGEQEVSEERTYVFYADDTPNITTDMTVIFRAEEKDAIFHDTKEGGICAFRLNPQIDEKHGNGRMTNSEGQTTAAECWGQPAKWNDYSGNLDGRNLGIAVFDHPKNLRHPTTWHIRDYGLYTANPFGLSYFTHKEKNGDYTINKGDSLTFHYRVFIHEGNTEEADIEAHYTAYVSPPTVKLER